MKKILQCNRDIRLMDIYNKLPQDLQNLVKFHLNKHLDIYYLNKLAKRLYFNNITKDHLKKKFTIFINNINKLKIDDINFKFKFPYKVIKEDGNYCLRYYKIHDYYNNEFYKFSLPSSYERLNAPEF